MLRGGLAWSRLHRAAPLRRALAAPSFDDLAARLASAEAAISGAPASRRRQRPAVERLAETHRRGLSVVLRKAQARVAYALDVALADAARGGRLPPPLDAVRVCDVRLAPDFRHAVVAWHLEGDDGDGVAPPPAPARVSPFFGDDGPPVAAAPRAAARDAAAAARDAAAARLARLAPSLRIAVARRARLRYAPEIIFRYDARRNPEGFSPEHARDHDASGGAGGAWPLDEGEGKWEGE